MQGNTLLIYADVMERSRFFSKFYRPLQEEMGVEVWFVTAKLSVFRALKQLTDNVVLFKRAQRFGELTEKIDFDKSLSVLNGYHTYEEAQVISNAVYRQLQLFSARCKPRMIWIWNGTTTIAMTLGVFARRHGIETRYFEISNLGNRIFVDTEGTSGASYLARHSEILDHVRVDEKAYQAWLTGYRAQYGVPKQAANRSRIPLSAAVDFAGYLFGCLREDRRNPFKLVWSRLRNKVVTQKWPVADLSMPYLFLPLQVSDDSQLKLYSKYSNMDMIRNALELSRKKSCRLIVKLHPAESEQGAIDSILAYAKEEAFIVAGNPTPELIECAETVVVNNSTVGLEAMIAEKEVVVFGNALYRYFTPQRLKAYILYYLLPGDYFGDTPISVNTVQKIMTAQWWDEGGSR